jgi:hypothetical protein
MFSKTLRRSAVTLGVVAGLLAAAGPAGAASAGVVTDNKDPDRLSGPAHSVTMLDYEGQTVVTYRAAASLGRENSIEAVRAR